LPSGNIPRKNKGRILPESRVQYQPKKCQLLALSGRAYESDARNSIPAVSG